MNYYTLLFHNNFLIYNKINAQNCSQEYMKIHRNMQQMVPRAGLEPARDDSRGILSPLRLPLPPPGHDATVYGGWGRNRTGVHGFAGRCITTLPPSPMYWEQETGAGNEYRTRDLNLGKVALCHWAIPARLTLLTNKASFFNYLLQIKKRRHNLPHSAHHTVQSILRSYHKFKHINTYTAL